MSDAWHSYTLVAERRMPLFLDLWCISRTSDDYNSLRHCLRFQKKCRETKTSTVTTVTKRSPPQDTPVLRPLLNFKFYSTKFYSTKSRTTLTQAPPTRHVHANCHADSITAFFFFNRTLIQVHAESRASRPCRPQSRGQLLR